MQKRPNLEDLAEMEGCCWKRLRMDGRDETDQEPAKAVALGSAELLPAPVLVVPKNVGMAPDDHTKEKQGTSKGLRGKKQIKNSDLSHGKGKESEEFVQDQIILAPEIMKNILEHLNVRALKQVRLVCKSWLLEAQSHMERRVVLRLGGYKSSKTIQYLIELRETKIPALPQPFLYIDVHLNAWRQSAHFNRYLSKLPRLCPPLVITRFSPACLPLTFVLPLIVRSAPNLEYLQLFAEDWDEGCVVIFLRNPGVKFTKLRHFHVDVSVMERSENCQDFPLIVAWIMRASPNVDTFETWANCYINRNPEELGSEVLLGVDIGNVTTLKLGGFDVEEETLKHIESFPFSKLQNLCMSMLGEESVLAALISIMTKAATSLRKLELLSDKDLVSTEGFPLCPNVQELYLDLFPGWSTFVSRCFPSLVAFFAAISTNYSNKLIFSECSRRPFVGVKTLRLDDANYSAGSSGSAELFTAFPALESLSIHQGYLCEYFRLSKARGDFWYFYLDPLESLKHLELCSHYCQESDRKNWIGYSALSELKGIETLTLKATRSDIINIPVKEMTSLRLLRFEWDECLNPKLGQVVTMARGVERVSIGNCCSILGVRSTESKHTKRALRAFFDFVPNAACGCKEPKVMLPVTR